MNKSTYLGAAAVALAAALWGVSGVIFIPRLNNLPTTYVVFIMHFLPIAILSFFFYRQYLRAKEFSASDWILLLLIAGLGAILGTMAIVKALFLVNFHHLSVVVLLQKVQPVFAILLAGIFLKEKITKAFAGLTVVILLGCYFLTFGLHFPFFENDMNTLYAALLAIFAAFGFGSSTVFSKMIAEKHSSFTISFYRYLLTSVILGIWLVFTGDILSFEKTTFDNWIIFLLIILTSGFLSIYCYYFGLKHIRAGVATFCELSMPITAVLLDYFVNHSVLSAAQIAGGVVMMIAIIVLVKVQTIQQKQS